MGYPILPVSIQQITISKCGDFVVPSGQTVEQSTFTSLRALKLRDGAPSILDWGVFLLLSSSGEIECLALDMISENSSLIAQEIINAGHAGLLRNLKELHLPWTMALGDEFVTDLVAVCPQQLEVVDLSYTDITGAGLKKLVLAEQNLRKLILKNCVYLSSDAVEWARARGILVDSSSIARKKSKCANAIRRY